MEKQEEKVVKKAPAKKKVVKKTEDKIISKFIFVGAKNDETNLVGQIVKAKIPEGESVEFILLEEEEIDLIMKRRIEIESNATLESYIKNPSNIAAAKDLAFSIRKAMNTNGFFKIEKLIKHSVFDTDKVKEIIASLEMFGMVERDNIGHKELIRILLDPKDMAKCSLKEIDHHMRFVRTAIKNIVELKYNTPEDINEMSDLTEKVRIGLANDIITLNIVKTEVPV